jgi:hypothetical protein
VFVVLLVVVTAGVFVVLLVLLVVVAAGVFVVLLVLVVIVATGVFVVLLVLVVVVAKGVFVVLLVLLVVVAMGVFVVLLVLLVFPLCEEHLSLRNPQCIMLFLPHCEKVTKTALEWYNASTLHVRQAVRHTSHSLEHG